MTGTFIEGLIYSAIMGLTLSFGIIYLSPKLLNMLNEVEKSSKGKSNLCLNISTSSSGERAELSRQAKKLVNILGVSNVELSQSLKEEFVVRKSRKLQKVLGISEIDVREEVRKVDSEKSEIEDLILKKTSKIQKVLGMNEQDIREAARAFPLRPAPLRSGSFNTTGSTGDKNVAEQKDEPVNWFKVLDGFVIIILLAVFCYFFNVSTNGDFARVLVGLFPKEFEALGLKNYFERLSPEDPRMTA